MSSNLYVLLDYLYKACTRFVQGRSGSIKSQKKPKRQINIDYQLITSNKKILHGMKGTENYCLLSSRSSVRIASGSQESP